MSDCLFCKIIAGEIPSHKIYEDAETFAFLDIGPVNPGHTLIVPKGHYENCHETPDAAMAAVMRTLKRVADAAMKATGAQGYNVGINCGKVAHQVVMHTHAHMMPRFEGDGLVHWGKRDIPAEEMQKTADAMRAAIS